MASRLAGALAAGEVHVWRASLDDHADDLDQVVATLAPDERARAARFLRAQDRARYVVGRSVLRTILARYLGTSPGSLRFIYDEHGKPQLAPEWRATGLRFNLAHSAGLAVYAVTHGREVGIDLEHVRSDFPIVDTVIAYMTPDEAAALRRLPLTARPLAAYRWWTRREAQLKACGRGLAGLPHEPQTSEVSQTSEVFRCMDLDAAPGYAAALVVAGHDWQLRLFTFEGPAPEPGSGAS